MEKSIEELYAENEKYILQTIYRQFPHYKSFLLTHGLKLEDIMQYGRIGLYLACKTYDITRGTSIKSHAIRHIIWSIKTELRKDSLNNISRRSIEIIEKVSLDGMEKLDSDDEVTSLHDVIGMEEDAYDEIVIRNILDSIKKNLPEKVYVIVKMRYEGCTFEEIAKAVGKTKEGCRILLKRYEKKIRNYIIA